MKYNIGDLLVAKPKKGLYKQGYIAGIDCYGSYGVKWKDQEECSWYSIESLDMFVGEMYYHYPVVKV